jgi:hypothetical protein
MINKPPPMKMPLLFPEFAATRGKIVRPAGVVAGPMLKGATAAAPDLVCGKCEHLLVIEASRHELGERFTNSAIVCPNCQAINDIVAFVRH